MKCVNNCQDKAETNFTWLTSNGSQSANLCGCCAAQWWNMYKNTNAGQSLIIDEHKKQK